MLKPVALALTPTSMATLAESEPMARLPATLKPDTNGEAVVRESEPARLLNVTVLKPNTLVIDWGAARLRTTVLAPAAKFAEAVRLIV